MVETVILSPRYSFKGYNLLTAIYRNKDSIKGILALLAGATVIIGVDWKKLLLALTASVLTLIVKLLVDAFDYFFAEIKQE